MKSGAFQKGRVALVLTNHYVKMGWCLIDSYSDKSQRPIKTILQRIIECEVDQNVNYNDKKNGTL